MVHNPPDGYPRITPYLLYRDVAGALDFLTKAFGFRETVRMPAPDGAVMHAEIEFGGGVVMMGNPGPDYQNPKEHGHRSQIVYVYVDEVDRHFEHAKAAGAAILSAPEDKFYGDRAYVAEDPEGHQWNFAEHVRDVSADEMTAAAATA
ncbi:MAG TPA: VOC family protein [Candidatus Dormibacteraeota bacterium]